MIHANNPAMPIEPRKLQRGPIPSRDHRERILRLPSHPPYFASLNRLASLLLAGAVVISSAWPQTFTTIDFPGATDTNCRAINPQGDIVGNYIGADGRFHGFLLKQGIFSQIDVPGALTTFVSGINPAGEMVGQYTPPDGRTHGFRFRAGVFESIDFPGAVFTFARGINPAGDIVGEYRDTTGRTRGFLLSHGMFVPIDFPNAVLTTPNGISPTGDIVGSYRDTSGISHGFLLGRSGFALIQPSGAIASSAAGISATGENCRELPRQRRCARVRAKRGNLPRLRSARQHFRRRHFHARLWSQSQRRDRGLLQYGR